MSTPEVATVTLADGTVLPAIGFGPGIENYRPNSALREAPRGSLRWFTQKVYAKLITRPLDSRKYVSAVTSALESGFRLLDYSAAYGSGRLIGASIKRSGVAREDLLLTTRVSNAAQRGGRSAVRAEFMRQLAGFGTDYVDILMFHWPVTGRYEDTWREMVELKREGLVRVIGVANCHQHHLERLFSLTDERPLLNQVEVHPLFTQKELLSYCRVAGVQVEAYTPVARFDDRLVRLPQLKEIAARHGKSVLQVVLRWHIQNGVIPVVRAFSPRHQLENIAVFDFTLMDSEMHTIDGFNINARLRYDPDNCDFSIL